ncbi:hypothetical protein I7I48_02581 [Histoplasma ohiense]|nr:hypothetical protein I7I48_02581 [Histoplasma ohiense (nom. inval.)]
MARLCLPVSCWPATFLLTNSLNLGVENTLHLQNRKGLRRPGQMPGEDSRSAVIRRCAMFYLRRIEPVII